MEYSKLTLPPKNVDQLVFPVVPPELESPKSTFPPTFIISLSLKNLFESAN